MIINDLEPKPTMRQVVARAAIALVVVLVTFVAVATIMRDVRATEDPCTEPYAYHETDPPMRSDACTGQSWVLVQKVSGWTWVPVVEDVSR